MAAGTKWYNNGEINIQLKLEDPVPAGFVPGMKKYYLSEESKKSKSEKTRKTCLQKYGVENPSQVQEIKNRKSETLMKHYGVSNPMHDDGIKENLKKAVLDKYGVEYSWQAESVKEKIRKSNLERYGVENPMKSEIIREKAKKTNLDRYGTVCPTQLEEIKEKTKQTNIKKYGVDSPAKVKEFQEKAKKTTLERYGVEHATQSKEIQEKVKQTNLKNLGVEYPMQSQEVRDKSRKSVDEKYGGFTFSSEVLSKKVRKTCLDRYGEDWYSKSNDFKKKFKRTCIKRYGVEHHSKTKKYKEAVKKTNLERYGVPWFCMMKKCRRASTNNSRPNKKFEKCLENYSIFYEREFNVNRFSYDFKVENFLIEINPFATHNSSWGIFGKGSAKPFDYHLKKSINAEKEGYHCIHIFDWDSYEDIINKFLLNQEYTDYSESVFFRNENSDNFYLFDEKSAKSLNHIPFLIKDFLKNHNNASIEVVSDRCKFPRNIYSSLGFNIVEEIEPACHWYNLKDGSEFIGEESKFTTDSRYIPIFDCGFTRFLLKST